MTSMVPICEWPLPVDQQIVLEYPNSKFCSGWFYIGKWRLIFFWSFRNIAEIFRNVSKIPNNMFIWFTPIIKFPESILNSTCGFFVQIRHYRNHWLSLIWKHVSIFKLQQQQISNTYLLFIWHTPNFKFPESILDYMFFVHIRH